MLNEARVWVIVGGLSTAACSAGKPAPAASPGDTRECATRLAARAPDAATDARDAAATTQLATAGDGAKAGEDSWAPPSLVVVNVVVPLEAQRARLEAQIPQRISEGRVGIGSRGLAYVAERDALSLRVSGGQAVVDAPLRVELSECDGGRCKPLCELRGVARAQVPLLLRSDYAFQGAKVKLHFTKGCSVRVLGFVTVSVTPQLEGLLRPQLDRVARQIDAQLPDTRAYANQAWAELHRARELPFGACAVVQPTGLVQGPIEDSTELLRARFAVIAQPELRSRCDAPLKPAPLPALQADAALSEDGLVMLGMAMPLTQLERAFTTAAHPAERRVESARVVPRGSEVDVELELSGRVCGPVAFTAQPTFERDGVQIGLSHAQLSAAERRRWTAAGLEPSATLEQLRALPRLPPPISVQGVRDAIPVLGSVELRPGISLETRVLSAHAAGAAARRQRDGAQADELVAWIAARGSIRLAVAP